MRWGDEETCGESSWGRNSRSYFFPCVEGVGMQKKKSVKKAAASKKSARKPASASGASEVDLQALLSFAEAVRTLPDGDAGVGRGVFDADETPEEMADDCFFEAMEAQSMSKVRKKLNEALKLDPTHVRAQTALAMMAEDPAEVERGIRRAIAMGEQKLGDLLKDGNHGGCLWGMLEARPYMEARGELADLLIAWERPDEAIAEYQQMLVLNSNDNQGVRDNLLGLLLETHRYKEARALAKRYDSDYSAVWLYGKAFLALAASFEKKGADISSQDGEWLKEQFDRLAAGQPIDLPEPDRKAVTTLEEALKFNPWCAIHLMKADEHLDDELPSMYSAGSVEEAVLFMDLQSTAWMRHPKLLLQFYITAVPWLCENGYEDEVAP